jgi:hypothetical protein
MKIVERWKAREEGYCDDIRALLFPQVINGIKIVSGFLAVSMCSYCM